MEVTSLCFEPFQNAHPRDKTAMVPEAWEAEPQDTQEHRVDTQIQAQGPVSPGFQ